MKKGKLNLVISDFLTAPQKIELFNAHFTIAENRNTRISQAPFNMVPLQSIDSRATGTYGAPGSVAGFTAWTALGDLAIEASNGDAVRVALVGTPYQGLLSFLKAGSFMIKKFYVKFPSANQLNQNWILAVRDITSGESLDEITFADKLSPDQIINNLVEFEQDVLIDGFTSLEIPLVGSGALEYTYITLDIEY